MYRRYLYVILICGLLSPSHLHGFQIGSSTTSRGPALEPELPDKDKIESIICDIVQGVRSGDAMRIKQYFLSSSIGSTNDLLDISLRKYRETVSTAIKTFEIDSVQIDVRIDTAIVKCLVSDPDGHKSEMSIRFRKHNQIWRIEQGNKVLKRLADFLEENGVLSERLMVLRSQSPAQRSLQKNEAANKTTWTDWPVNIVESQHSCVPNNLTNTDNWQITKQTAISKCGNPIMTTIDDYEYVPLYDASDNYVEQYHFFLDRSQGRIIFGSSMGDGWINCYGDGLYEYHLYDARGMRALQFPDGSINIFVTEAHQGEIVQLQLDRSNHRIFFVRRLKGPLMKPVDVDLEINDVYDNPTTYNIWVADKGLAALVCLAPDGSERFRINQYSELGIAHLLTDIKKFCVFYEGAAGEYDFWRISLIDANRNALVSFSADVVDDELKATSTAITEDFLPPSQLMNIAYKSGNIFVIDQDNKIHGFSLGGHYLYSFFRYSSSAAQNPGFFSRVAGKTLFDQPITISSCRIRHKGVTIDIIDFGFANDWNDNSGMGMLIPGADVVDFRSTATAQDIWFEYDLTNTCIMDIKIYNSSGQIVTSDTGTLHPGYFAHVVHCPDYASGSYTFQVAVTPNWNNISQYQQYRQNPVIISYPFAINQSISGTIYSNSTWAGIYNVVGNVTINPGVTLEIKPGTMVRFQADYSMSVSEGAKIIAKGTALSPIHFTQLNSGYAWDRIYLCGNNNEFAYSVFEGGWYNIHAHMSSGNTFTNCTFQYAMQAGLYLRGSNATISNCAFMYNYDGIRLSSGATASIDQSTLSSNNDVGLYMNASTIAEFAHNVVENNGSHGIWLLSGTLALGHGLNYYPYPYGTPDWNTPTAESGKNRISNNCLTSPGAYQIFVDNAGRLYAGDLILTDDFYISQGYNMIWSPTHLCIANFAMTGDYENQQQWPIYAKKNAWGGIPDNSYFSGTVYYYPVVAGDPTTGAGPSIILQKGAGPEKDNSPGTVMTSAIAAKVSESGSTSSRQQSLVDLKNRMLEVRNSLNNPKNNSIRPRLIERLNSLRAFDMSDATQEGKGIEALLAQYRERLVSGQFTDPTDRLCSEAALTNEVQNALHAGNIIGAQDLIKKYSPYVNNNDNKRALLLAEVDINARQGEYTKAMTALYKAKQFQPDATQRKKYAAPPYYVMESMLRQSAKEAGKTIDEQQIQEQLSPTETLLLGNNPNPFNPSTVITYKLLVAGRVSLKVYDILGREVATLVEGQKEAGYYTETFNGSRFSSGVYFARFVAQPQDRPQIVQVKKMLMIK